MLHRGTLSRKGLASNYKDYSDFFYNDITEGDHQERSSPCPCDSGEGLRWEKNFIMMEDLHVMHKILLQANEELKMEISSLRNHMQKLSRDISTTCLRVVGETCRSMNAQQNLTGKQNTTQLKQEVQQNGNVTDNVMEEMEEVRRREMKDLKNVHRMMEMDKTENMEENAEWGRWIKWIFW
ncbi:pentraxin-related protein PTX3 isoform X4 [Tachysurus vachellii]|uniref:pentraxin-related protein PTX3 isoform X4 n=1 Tax=Tachysurus vachellii TaxID=175792 RepID=UPI00296B54DE|nr:pentraxin-related protein PTX3 isoform X4 [Tachysurus vachellii]